MDSKRPRYLAVLKVYLARETLNAMFPHLREKSRVLASLAAGEGSQADYAILTILAGKSFFPIARETRGASRASFTAGSRDDFM